MVQYPISRRIRADPEIAGTPIGPYDIQIAAIAIHNNLTLVTHNTREFSRIPDLKIEDYWNIIVSIKHPVMKGKEIWKK